MFIGHTAAALAAKSIAPRASLGLLIGAAFFLDLLWPFFLLAGIERLRIAPGDTAFTPIAFDHYPWSHSLLMVVVWGALLAVISRAGRTDRWTGIVIFLTVASHWVLDFVTHRPDLPLWPGESPKFGLGLWNSVAGTLIVEAALLGASVAIYVRASRANDRRGRLALWSLVGLQTAIWISGPFSTPPPGAVAVALVGLALWLFPFWGAWIDRHRSVR